VEVVVYVSHLKKEEEDKKKKEEKRVDRAETLTKLTNTL
jgi:hypothetical protein